MKKILSYISAIIATGLAVACSDDLPEGTTPSGGDSQGTGEMVLFAAGTTENSVTRADGARRYFMPDGYRFVCRMYYKAQTGSDKFDVQGNTDQVTWLKVNGNIGNSLYWNKNYTEVGTFVGKGGIDDYGNDYSATAFYWQNRKEHAFLAWTDLNKATELTNGNTPGTLKFDNDTDYRIYSNDKVKEYDLAYYEIYGINQHFADQEAMEEYVRNHGDEQAFKDAQTQLATEKNWTWDNTRYNYRHGWQYKWSAEHTERANFVQDESYDWQWYQEFMYFQTLPYTPDNTEEKEMSKEAGKTDRIAYLRKNGVRVAKAVLKVNNEDQPVDDQGNVISDPANYIYTYEQTDEYGNLRYDETNPQFTFYFSIHRVMKERLKYEDYPCNKFDLTRGNRTSMAQQPDIAQALEIQAPSGATQEFNRVNLYFKHQFSQIQVNVKNSMDNSVSLESGNILKVELLGVSEEGYVFTELDENGKVLPAKYKEIDFSKFTEAQLKNNEFGTSFDMFPMADGAPGYLRSFNCITFGQLQAIRITWKEKETDYTHASTFRIPDTELVNLKSGVKYIWNIEIRRGTLAIIRTEIVDWELPADAPHNGSADGTIHN